MGDVQQVVLYLPVAAGARSHFPEGLKSKLRADLGCKRCGFLCYGQGICNSPWESCCTICPLCPTGPGREHIVST